jgi:hypothetical protein
VTPAELLETLVTRQVVLIPDGEMLRYRAPLGALSPDLIEEVRTHKPDLLNMLTEAPRPHLGSCGELVIPFGCPVAYSWWLAASLGERRRRFEAARSAAPAGASPKGWA